MWWKALANSIAHGAYVVNNLVWTCENCNSQEFRILFWRKEKTENGNVTLFILKCINCGREEMTKMISKKI